MKVDNLLKFAERAFCSAAVLGVFATDLTARKETKEDSDTRSRKVLYTTLGCIIGATACSDQTDSSTSSSGTAGLNSGDV